jgi:dTDP-4-amino-4,6-dideoxygalactose transaminase
MIVQVPLSKPWFDDSEPLVASEVVKSGWLFMGPQVREFEMQFAAMIGTKHAIAVNSGSSALLVTLLSLGIGPGDEILAPDMTFVSTASCALFTGATPKFVDIELNTYGMDPADLERRITPQTRAIIPVHYAGQTAEMRPILDIAATHGIPVIEDAAEAQMSCYGDRNAGTLAKAAIFSFTPSKLMTVGEGGMIVTDDDGIAERAGLARNFGDQGKFAWSTLGFNFRMMDIQGAIGLRQLHKVHEAVRRRRLIAQEYTNAFRKIPGVVTPYVRREADTNFQLYTILIGPTADGIDRDDFMQTLATRGVASRLYYPALHRAPVFAHTIPGSDDQFPNATYFAQSAVSLPIYPTMTEEEIRYVIRSVEDIMAAPAASQSKCRTTSSNQKGLPLRTGGHLGVP